MTIGVSEPGDGAGTSSVDARLRVLGIELPRVPEPVGNFVHGVEHGGLLYLSGQGPLLANGELARGKVGADVSGDEAREHARRVGLVLLSAMRARLGSLDRVERIVKILGMVNSLPDFMDHPRVIDGCSDLFHEVFGERGVHARSAVGVESLPGGITVEIEAIVAVRSKS